MKLRYFASAALAAAAVAAAAPAFASEGYIDGGYIQRQIGSAVREGYTLSAAYNSTPAAGAWGWQGDFAYENGSSVHATAGALTIFNRQDNNLFGVFLGAERVSSTPAMSIGIIGQHYTDSMTLSGNVSYGDMSNGADNYYAVNGGLAFYATEEVSFAGSVNYLKRDSLTNGVATYGVTAEWKPDDGPMSFYAGYDRVDNSGAADADYFQVGFRFNSGAKTIRDRDQKGAFTAIGRQRAHF